MPGIWKSRADWGQNRKELWYLYLCLPQVLNDGWVGVILCELQRVVEVVLSHCFEFCWGDRH